MMNYNKHFISGVVYRLGRLLDNDVKIIIPDLQRDYCWGTTKDDQQRILADKFVQDLIDQYISTTSDSGNSSEVSLGLLYGYETIRGQLQLCDGQQRITTLYLLLGMLNRKTRTLQDRLLSQREIDEYQEPYLQYSIRESTLYFMNDLVQYFFLSDNIVCVDDIKKQTWYFDEYNQDPSIQSMIEAMKCIELRINILEGDLLYRFGHHLCQNIKFIYYDMNTRREGEKTFVIINTKGEPLSPTENLKPLFLKHYRNSGYNVGQKWEEMETFFWQHRNNGHDTADAGMREFFRWIMLIHYITNNKSDTAEYDDIRQKGKYAFDTSIGLDVIDRYFQITKELFSPSGLFANDQKMLSPLEVDNNNEPVTNQSEWYRLLPVMYYMYRFPDAQPREIKRIHHFFFHTSNLQNVAKAIRTLLPAAILSVHQMTSSDILDLDTHTSSTIFNDEELRKFNLCGSYKGKRNDFEDELWKAEDYKVGGIYFWQNSINPILDWASIRTGCFNLQDFIEYRDVTHRIVELPQNDLDKFRRLLLANNPQDYPCHINTFEPKRNTYYSFGYLNNEWREVIEKNSVCIQPLLKNLIGSKNIVNDIEKQLQSTTSSELFVREPRLLEACQKKLAGKGASGIDTLVQGVRGSVANVKSYRFYLYLTDLELIFPNNWHLVNYYWDPDGGCTFFENDVNSNPDRLVIDVALRDDKDCILFFSRDESKTKSLCGSIADKYKMIENEKNGRYLHEIQADDTKMADIISFIMQLMS